MIYSIGKYATPEQQKVNENFVNKIHYGIGLIAHSCGVKHPRELSRYHCRIVQSDGKSISLDVLYPEQEVLEKYSSLNR